MHDGPVPTKGPLIIITNADMNIKEMAIAQQLRDSGIDFNHIMKKRGSSKVFVFFSSNEDLNPAAELIRMLKAPITKQHYDCEVSTQELMPTVPETIIGADLKTVNGLLNFSQLNDNGESQTLNRSFGDVSIFANGDGDTPTGPTGSTTGAATAIGFYPSMQKIQRSSTKIVLAVAPYYADNAEDEVLAKSKIIRNSVKGQMARMYKHFKNTNVLPVWAKRNECVSHLRQPVTVYGSPLLIKYRSKAEFTVGWSDNLLNTSTEESSTTETKKHSEKIAVGPCVRQGKKMTVFDSSQLSEANIFPSVTIILSSLLEKTLSTAYAAGKLSDGDLALFSTLAIRCAGVVSNSQFNVSQILIGIVLRIELSEDSADKGSSSQSAASTNTTQSQTPTPVPGLTPPPEEYTSKLKRVWPLILDFQNLVSTSLKNLYHLVFYVQTTTVRKGSSHCYRYYPVTQVISETSASRFYITQSIYNLNFRIGPGTFFQSNIATFTMILEYASDKILGILTNSKESRSRDGGDSRAPSPQTVEILDICCGCGVIGQCLAQILLKNMISSHDIHINLRGIDCSSDAIWNSELNSAENFANNPRVSTFYHCGKVEQSAEFFSGSARIGILDPPRSGVFPGVIAALRHSTLEYVIYISCNPKTMSQNIIDLSMVSQDTEPTKRTCPFYIKSIVGFNMFPGCEHVESVAILQRCPDLEGNPPPNDSA